MRSFDRRTGEAEVQLHPVHNPTLEGGSWSALHSYRFTFRKDDLPQGRLGRHGKPPPTEVRTPEHPARNELLYGLRYIRHGTATYVTELRIDFQPPLQHIGSIRGLIFLNLFSSRAQTALGMNTRGVTDVTSCTCSFNPRKVWIIRKQLQSSLIGIELMSPEGNKISKYVWLEIIIWCGD